MDVVRDRGLALAAAHCRSLDPSTATARERLDATLGVELARLLVFALSSETPAGEDALRAGAVFAA